jgi:hypothetical protein
VTTPGALHIARLLEPGFYPHPVGTVELVETHISWVLLTGSYAYKVKKPLDLGFLDFSTLEKREHCCREELRLNRRLAPHIYLEVVAITGTPESPVLAGPGTPIEYAVKMRQFAQDGLLDRRLAAGTLPAELIDRLARRVAEFHGGIERAPEGSDFGTPERAHYPVEENFRQTRPLITDPTVTERLEHLGERSEAAYVRLRPALAARREGGFIRECHGDMHLGNMAEVSGELVIFDGIEFNPNLRWIDVMSEVAFFCMDLEQRGRADYAWRFLNGYLEVTGDYAGLAVLRYYQSYRAMVRAKVTAIRLGQPDVPTDDRARAEAAFLGYLGQAEGYAAAQQPFLLLTRGPSGAGKTVVAGTLCERLGAVRVRSDVERKRLAGLAPEARSGSGLASGLYSDQASGATYGRLVSLARQVLEAGLPVVLDATFLLREQREMARRVARSLGVPFLVLDVSAPADVLRARVAERERAATDASEASAAVLERQLQGLGPLDPDEATDALAIDTSAAVDPDQLALGVRQRLPGLWPD